jgi:hypothetical protein
VKYLYRGDDVAVVNHNACAVGYYQFGVSGLACFTPDSFSFIISSLVLELHTPLQIDIPHASELKQINCIKMYQSVRLYS